MVCLRETKFQDMSTGVVRSLKVGRFFYWSAVNVGGVARGILLF